MLSRTSSVTEAIDVKMKIGGGGVAAALESDMFRITRNKNFALYTSSAWG